MKIESYLLVCEDHDNEMIEFWKYDSIEDTEHSPCKTRPITPEELIDYLLDPEEQNCIDEEFFGNPQTARGRNLQFLRDMVKSISYRQYRQISLNAEIAGLGITSGEK